jgi:hypothetical protein
MSEADIRWIGLADDLAMPDYVNVAFVSSNGSVNGIDDDSDDEHNPKGGARSVNGSESGGREERSIDGDDVESAPDSTHASKEKKEIMPVDQNIDSFEEDLYDDGLTSLTADEYVKIRLIPVVAGFTVEAPGLSNFLSVVTSLVIGLSVLSSVFSTFNLVTFIPLLFAFSGALTSWASYNQTDLKLVQTNRAKHQLHQLLIWWDSLSMIEKRVPANKEYLVQVTETAFQGQIVGQTATKSSDEDRDDHE